MDSNQAKVYTAILIAALVLGAIVVYFLVTIVRTQRRYLKLEKGNMLAQFTALETERHRIVSDLHDELGPLLSVVKLQVSNLAWEHDARTELMFQANNNLETISSRMRGICNQLMPQSLTRDGVICALRDFCTDIQRYSDTQVEFSCDPKVIIPSNAEVQLYRVVQEIVNNAIKHAEAALIVVDIQQKEKRLIVTICDNGKGFDVEKIRKEKNGYGLNNIVSRMNLLGGEVYLTSEIGKGTSYSIELMSEN